MSDLLDIKSFGGLNCSPAADGGDCAIAVNLDDTFAPALRTACGFTETVLSDEGVFQGHLVEGGQTVMSVFDDTLYVGTFRFPLEPLGVPRKFLRLSRKEVLILPDVYLYSYRYRECEPLDKRHTSKGTTSVENNMVVVRLENRSGHAFHDRVYLEGAGYTYYDPETNPTSGLLYFRVVEYEKNGDGCTLTLQEVTNGDSIGRTDKDENGNLTLRQVYPRMDDVMIFRNRLWCVGGATLSASKLGDYLNFTDFAGLSTDSFSLELEELLTTVSHFGERVVFMSRGHLYELFGDRPTNYQVSAAKTGGCSHPDSVCTAGGYLIYADDTNLYRYGGGDPQIISGGLDLPAWSSVFGVSGGETCYLGLDTALYRYRPKRNTFYAVGRNATLGVTQENTPFFYYNKGYFCPNRERTGSVHYRSGWICLDRMGRAAPKELLLRIDGATDAVHLVTRDGTAHRLTALDDRGDGLLRLPLPADLTHRVFAVDVCGHGDFCLHRITVRG